MRMALFCTLSIAHDNFCEQPSKSDEQYFKWGRIVEVYTLSRYSTLRKQLNLLER